MQVEHGLRKRKHFQLRRKSDAPTRTRKPRDVVGHVDQRHALGDHVVLKAGKELLEYMASTK